MNKQILVFRTSIKNKQEIKRIGFLFLSIPQISKWTIDLEDWEKILRIESIGVSPAEILQVLQTAGIFAEELEDTLSASSNSDF